MRPPKKRRQTAFFSGRQEGMRSHTQRLPGQPFLGKTTNPVFFYAGLQLPQDKVLEKRVAGCGVCLSPVRRHRNLGV